MIEVRIPRSRNEDVGHEVLTSRNFVERLKEKGIPVVGTLVIRGVEHGTLSHTNDPADGAHIFKWDGGEENLF